MASMNETIAELVAQLDLTPHPEGGFYREVYRSEESLGEGDEKRSCGTAIYFLLPGTTFSAFHKVKGSDEIWHYYAGAPLELHVISDTGSYEKKILGNAIPSEEPLQIVPANSFQAARSLGDWTLVGCTVTPGFDFRDFEMPERSELIEKFPQFEELITQFTR